MIRVGLLHVVGQILPHAHTETKTREFLMLKQESMSVMEYASKVTELSRFAPKYVATN